MKREDMDDETAKQGQKEEKCHNCVVGAWLKGQDCCAGSQDKNNSHFHMLRSQCFDGSHNREYNFFLELLFLEIYSPFIFTTGKILQ